MHFEIMVAKFRSVCIACINPTLWYFFSFTSRNSYISKTIQTSYSVFYVKYKFHILYFVLSSRVNLLPSGCPLTFAWRWLSGPLLTLLIRPYRFLWEECFYTPRLELYSQCTWNSVHQQKMSCDSIAILKHFGRFEIDKLTYISDKNNRFWSKLVKNNRNLTKSWPEHFYRF